eukprot:Pgem_evm1s651
MTFSMIFLPFSFVFEFEAKLHRIKVNLLDNVLISDQYNSGHVIERRLSYTEEKSSFSSFTTFYDIY